MVGKIFVNYRRDDDPSGAARIRDGLAAKFGRASVFMDVDNLLAGQRFDEELAKALTACDVLLAIVGPRWIELMRSRAASGERDYVREEIAGALQRKLVVIPVRVGREGQLATLPRAEDLPDNIRDLVLYQKHDVAHERFSRDIADLIEAIGLVRRTRRSQLASQRPWSLIAGAAAALAFAGYAAAYYVGVPVPWPSSSPAADSRADEMERLRVAAAKAEDERKRLEALEAQIRERDAGLAKAEAERKRLAEIAERERRDREQRQIAEAAAAREAEDRARAKAEADRVAAASASLQKGTGGWLGVTLKILDADLAKSLGLADTAGALVQGVSPKGPADIAGLRGDDVILSVNGIKIKDIKDFALKVAEFPPDSVLDLRVMRRRREEAITVRLGRTPGSNPR